MPSDLASIPTPTYRLLTWALYPAIVAYTLYLALKNRDSRYFFQRLGFSYPQFSSGPIVWVHCASVGEVKTVTPLLQRLGEQFPHLHFVVTTHTHTGAEIVSQLDSQCFTHIYCPLDYAFTSRRFLQSSSPILALFMETEIWPNLIFAVANDNIPLSIINGRVSRKTFKAPSFVQKNYQRALKKITKVFAQSSEDRERFIALGAKSENIEVVPNLKYASANSTLGPLKNPLNIPFVLCASTHDDEEIQISRRWKKLGSREHALVIAPRHPNRIKEICKQFEQTDISYSLHSQVANQDPHKDVYLVDQIGMLEPFFQHAELVFVGGSLVDKGGHNTLEPARYSKCILSGPHFSNFADITQELADQQALIIVRSNDQLMEEINELLNQPEQRDRIGRQAGQMASAHTDIVELYLENLRDYLAT